MYISALATLAGDRCGGNNIKDTSNYISTYMIFVFYVLLLPKFIASHESDLVSVFAGSTHTNFSSKIFSHCPF